LQTERTGKKSLPTRGTYLNHTKYKLKHIVPFYKKVKTSPVQKTNRLTIKIRATHILKHTPTGGGATMKHSQSGTKRNNAADAVGTQSLMEKRKREKSKPVTQMRIFRDAFNVVLGARSPDVRFS